MRPFTTFRFARTSISALACALVANISFAQAPAPPVTSSGVAVASPTYVSIPLEITVNRPAADVWKRVGKWCDVGEWLQVPCSITWGKEGGLGAVRSIGGATTEVLVGQTQMSYTYTQPAREGQRYNLYHGTLEARPLTETTTKLLYTLVFDNSMLADGPARDRDIAGKTATFTRALQNMKTLAEGGTLPPPAARGAQPASGGGQSPARGAAPGF